MKKWICVGMMAVVMGGLAMDCWAQEESLSLKYIDETMEEISQLVLENASVKPPVEEKAPVQEDKIDLEFRQVNLEDVVRVIAETSGRNIVLDPAVRERKLDLCLKQVTVAEALEVIYNAMDLASTDVGSILFISQKEKIKKGNIQTKMFEVKNIGLGDAKSLVGNLVTAVNEGPETNCLVLVGTDQEISKALKILEEVDVPQPQVVLEAKIIEINEDALQEIGVDWPDDITLSAQESKREETLEGVLSPGTPPYRIHPFQRTAVQFDLIIKMLESQSKAKLLSSPRITTVNNKEAEIFIGDKIPYEIQTNNDGAVTTEVQFVEPGIRLKITPSIVEKDFVVIKVEPEVSFIYAFRGTDDQYPWVKSREATAYVRVRNGQPFVIGGLLNAEDKKNLYSVPFLGKLPLLGNLFSYSKDEQNKTDLIITVTPTVITDTL